MYNKIRLKKMSSITNTLSINLRRHQRSKSDEILYRSEINCINYPRTFDIEIRFTTHYFG